ncbi:MAG: NTP transferase domain-containing protein [Candidatus Kerfeldbacteria bacterium]|nr:NTP transferase domain-containing protein [Candidatus Kerfeldbacteria bacterium]
MTSTVVIMAAGRGTRMKGLANDRPKHLLTVLGRPFLDHLLDRLKQAGFRDIVMVTGHQNHAFQPYQGRRGIRLVEQQLLHERYGTAAAVESAREAVGQAPFAVVSGDNLYSVDDLRKVTIDSASAWIGGYKTAAWQGMGILKLKNDGALEKIIEKPQNFVGDLINASLYLFTPAIFEIIERLQPSPRGEYEITDAVNALAAREPVNVFELEDRWLDLTTPSDIPKIEKALRGGEI